MAKRTTYANGKSAPLIVLHVIETLSRGGAERLLVVVIPELARQGMRAEVVVLRGPLDLQAELKAEGISVHVLPKRGKWALLGAARDLARLAKKRKADILHAHLYFPTLITALTKVLHLFNGVTHASFHNLAYGGANKRTWKLSLRQKIAKFLVLRGIDQPQGVSQASADHFAAAYGLKNIVVIHNAMDMRILEGIDIPVGEAVVIPGRLVPEKGHLDVIAALGLLRIPCPEVIFAGDGPLRSRLESEIRAARLPITITGYLSYPEMLRTVASARLVVIPSHYEGFGLTALEALALGRPIVASTAGGLPEVMGSLGYQVAPNDPSALAQALETALTNLNWRQEQEAAGTRQAVQFSVRPIAARQIALYQQSYNSKGVRR